MYNNLAKHKVSNEHWPHLTLKEIRIYFLSFGYLQNDLLQIGQYVEQYTQCNTTNYQATVYVAKKCTTAQLIGSYILL